MQTIIVVLSIYVAIGLFITCGIASLFISYRKGERDDPAPEYIRELLGEDDRMIIIMFGTLFTPFWLPAIVCSLFMKDETPD